MSSALRTRRYAGSNPVGKANHRCIAQRESTPFGAEESRVQIVLHRPMTTARWPIGQATDSDSVQTGSIPVRAANLAPWRNRNAAVCKTAMSRGSTGRGFQHTLVDQLDGQPSSKRPYAGSSPVERAIGIGELAER